MIVVTGKSWHCAWNTEMSCQQGDCRATLYSAFYISKKSACPLCEKWTWGRINCPGNDRGKK